ncbi:MAG: type II toxin-antitoxin system VapC family toxin [Gammaproteobacteria bacterium]|nr:type II toxin-antitoxin system VapC family toxin [Gammaproteobacteria bacterium]
MIGLDTNVLVRYIVQDDAEQAQAATHLLENTCTEQSTGYVSVVVLVELVWVLAAAYDYQRDVIASVLGQILRTTEFTVEDGDLAWHALREFENGDAGFADCLLAHRNRSRGCSTTFTFDGKAAKGRHFTLVT